MGELGSATVVPSLVGSPFHIGRDLADECGLALANVDPDGPPIASLAWPGLFVITWQDPPPLAAAVVGDSVTVTVLRQGPEPESRVRPTGPP